MKIQYCNMCLSVSSQNFGIVLNLNLSKNEISVVHTPNKHLSGHKDLEDYC